MSRATAVKAVRFVAVGLLGLAVYWAAATALVDVCGWAPAFAHVFAYAGCIPPMYLLHHGFAFQADTAHAYSAPRYLAVQGANLALGAVLSPLLIARGDEPMLAYAVVGAANSGVGFLAQLGWTFRAGRTGRRAASDQ